MVNCPKCDSELQEDIGRIKVRHLFAEKKSGKSPKTSFRRVYYCPNCDKYFAPMLELVEVQVVAAR